MKYLKKFERFSEEEMDKILDKISEFGIESLSKEEKYLLDNQDEDQGDYKTKLIYDIKLKVIKYGSCISMQDIQADSSPVYKEQGQTIDLIERLNDDSVEVVSYGGYKYESELDEYDVKYEKLDIDTLEEILELLNDAIENEFLEEDI